MKLPLLGIIIIVLLQLGFTTYNALDRPLSSLYAVDRVATNIDSLAVLPNEPNTGSTYYAAVRSDVRNKKNRGVTFSRPDRGRSVDAAEQKVTFRNTVIRNPPSKSLMPHLVALQKLSEPTLPKHPQPMHAGGETENFAVLSYRTSEKRSFVAKSAAVLKKPYDWIKALGSKIN